MLGHPRPKSHQKCIKFLYFFGLLFWLSFLCFWLAQASKMDAQIAPESMKMVSWQASLQRVTKKSDFCHFLGGFFIYFLQIFLFFWTLVSRLSEAFQQRYDIKTIQENPCFCIKNNVVAKLTTQKKNKENYKKTLQKYVMKEDVKKSPLRVTFSLILDSQNRRNEAAHLKKTGLERYIEKDIKKK